MKLAAKLADFLPKLHPARDELIREAAALEEFIAVTREHNAVLQRRLDRALEWIAQKEREEKTK